MRTQQSKTMSYDYLAEANDHLKNGRFKMALASAKNAFQNKPDDSECALCLAWALLENGSPAKSMDYANLAVELSGGTTKARMYRGYLLMRMSILEGAIDDFDKSIAEQKDFLAFTYINKARTLAGMGKFEEGQKTLELALLINNNRNENWKKSRKWYDTASEIERGKIKVKEKEVPELLELGQEAIKTKDHWFALYVSNKILESDRVKKENDEVELLNLEAMLHLFQIRPALKRAKELKSKFSDSKKFTNIYNQLLKIQNADQDDDVIEIAPPPQPPIRETKETFQKPSTNIENKTYVEAPPPPKPQVEPENLRTDSVYLINDDAEVFSTKVFNVEEDKKTGKRIFYIHFNVNEIKTVGVEVIFNNPYFRMQNRTYNCKAVWYLNDYEIAANEFSLNVQNDWDSVIFAQTCGSNESGFWQYGQGRVDLYVNDEMVSQKWFALNDDAIKEEQKAPTPAPELPRKDTKMEVVKTKEQQENENKKEVPAKVEKEKSLEELLAELDKFIGLGSVKKSMRDFVDYLNFMQERKKLGLKSTEGLAINAVFLGNPGTGKTTIARVVGDIFKAMKILPKGHIIEVDRSALVGQYVGETAQKTDKVIEDAMGGILFIDEAYTLIKEGGGGQDFGQEAVDIILKRMEDKKGEFVIIAAGYPDNMETFLSSNPGMKSRFTHFFNFEDYSPDELLQIIDMFLKKEEYKITDEAKDLLNKEFINLYRARDKTFGNGRLARKYFEDSKMQLSRRVIKLPDAEKTKESMTTITVEDIKAILEKDVEKYVKLAINDEMLNEGLKALENLTGLGSVKNDVRDMVKLARYYIEQGEDVKDKFTSHVLFLGNPGTGKTTVARIMGKIYAALGILPKGHLVETDRQGLVASHVGQTAVQTTQMIDKSIGGTLFVDEAYALVKEGSGGDFGKEAIDTLLKRMEDDRGKFIVIAAGYTNEMKAFIESNPGMQSRFTKSFTFEDYTPEELIEITGRILTGKEMKLDEEAKTQLERHYNDIYRKRDKNFGNARIVRNLVDKALQKMLLRLADTPQEERTEEMTKTMILDDLRDQIMPKIEKQSYQTKGDPEKLEQYKKELYDLTGLDSVKRSVDKLISGLKVAQLRKERGLKVVEKSLHAVFMGNPGTGKTTVARLMSNLYKELGLIEKGHLVEVDRSELVAGYQGQTAIKTDKIIQQAIGGTLFIDEAYTLARGGNDFGQEAIDTLLKKMEDLRGQFICIVAGYPDDMKRFLDTNPGLQSRFSNYFLFEDYTPRQMLEISDQISTSSGYKLDEGALQLLLEIYSNLYENRDKNFGNARTARNILYKAISNQEERITNIYDLDDNALMTITFEDVEKVSEKDF